MQLAYVTGCCNSEARSVLAEIVQCVWSLVLCEFK